MRLAITGFDTSSGLLREIYEKLRVRPMPPVYRPDHGGVAGIVTAHSLDPLLIGRVFSTAATLDGVGPLTWPERELICTITSRSNQCFYASACHAEFLRVASEDEPLAKAVLDDPRALATTAPTPRMKVLAELATIIAAAPWTLSRKHLSRAHSAGLGDEDILHVVALASFAGHLDRIADATGVALDYKVAHMPPATDPSVEPWPTAPHTIAGRPAVELARRAQTAAALAEWRSYVFYRDAPLSRRQRTLIARWVAAWLGDGGISPPTDLTVNPLDDALRTVAEVITLAPWRITDETYEPLRAAGFDDVAIFDVCATATSAGVFSRIEVSLAALGT